MLMILTEIGDKGNKISVQTDNIAFMYVSRVDDSKENIPCTCIVMTYGRVFKVKETVEFITYIANNLPRVNKTTLIDRELVSNLARGYMYQYGGTIYYQNDTTVIK